MPFRLLPREERFFRMFVTAAENLAAGAAALAELSREYTDVPRKVAKIKEIEHAGDALTRSVMDALNRAFVTPFDRDDIARLANALDDVLDNTEEAARRLHTYRIEQPTEVCRELCGVIVEQSQLIARAVPLLDDLKETAQIGRYTAELHRLEKEGDQILERALGDLYAHVPDVQALARAVQWSDIYGILEGATDRAEDVAVAIETIVAKHA